MGTRGLYVFKYEGIYYVFYNHFNSYASYLGVRIVKDIRTVTNNNEWGLVKYLITKIPLRTDNSSGDSIYGGIINSSTNPLDFVYNTSDCEPVCNIFIEFIYIIDLDDDIFSIKTNQSEKSFALQDIPYNWIDIFENEDE